jgi:type IV pilus assembly protein PilA
MKTLQTRQHGNDRRQSIATGFTLIELMIVVAIIAIILTLALPVYTDYTIRAKVGEALSVAASTKTALASTCIENPELTGLTNAATGYGFETSTWVENIIVSGDCVTPVITITTRNTGATIAPQIILTGALNTGTGRMTWTCATTGQPQHVPSTCRS